MTEPSQYFKGRTVQEQMNEVIGYVDARSAEVATNAIAADVAQVQQDKLDADADAQAAAASAAAAAGTLANAVKKTGEASQSIAGDITVSGALSVSGAVTVPAPTGNTNATTKKYVDDQDALKVSITNINSYAVGLTGNQNNISGTKSFTGTLIQKVSSSPGGSPPATYVSNRGNIRISGNDDIMIVGMGFEKATSNIPRLVLSVNADTDINTGRQPSAEIHFILNEAAGTLVMQPAHLDKNGTRTFGAAQTLMTWTP